MEDINADIQEFYNLLAVKPLSSSAISLWHAINFVRQKSQKSNDEWFTIADRTLELFSGLKSRQSIATNRNILKQFGLVDFRTQGTKATFYKITITCPKNGQKSLQVGGQVSLQVVCPLINKIKINKLFNYLITNEEENFEDINPVDKMSIRNILKRLDILLSYDAIQLVSENKLNSYKIQYWCVKELYFSSFKVYLNSIEREFFLNKFYRTLENLKIDEIDLNRNSEDVVRYFIKTLKKEYEVKQ